MKYITNNNIFRKIETLYYDVKNHKGLYLIKFVLLIVLISTIIFFILNINKIAFISSLDMKLYIPLLDNLFHKHISLVYGLIYVISLVIIIGIIKFLFKKNYNNYNNALENSMKPKEKNEHLEYRAPQVITMYKNPLDKDVNILMVYSNNNTHEDFINNKELIQNNLNKQYIRYIEKFGTNKELIYISNTDITELKPINWDNKYLINDDGLKVIVGKRFDGKHEIWDLQKNNHGKLCGETRSGKTNTQKCINAQIVMHKDTLLLIYDGKGFDYKGIWRRLNNCIVVTKQESLLNYLKIINYEHENRIKLLNNKLNTIDKYNKEHSNNTLKYIVIVLEEAVDIFGKEFSKYDTSKENKEQLEHDKYVNSEIIRIIEELVRKGGATGISLIINSQKLTATILPKQIPVNLTKNYSLHVDEITSEIAVGNKDAYNLIPRGIKGILVDEEHNLIQSYLINDELALSELDNGTEKDWDYQSKKDLKIVEENPQCLYEIINR